MNEKRKFCIPIFSSCANAKDGNINIESLNTNMM